MRPWVTVAAINGFVAVALGAFSAHALQGRLDLHAMQTFETGARYQMYHALAMGLTSFPMTGEAEKAARWAAMLFLAGIILFSGSLYALALTGIRTLGIVTPFGGACFLAGWLALAWAGLRVRQPS